MNATLGKVHMTHATMHATLNKVHTSVCDTCVQHLSVTFWHVTIENIGLGFESITKEEDYFSATIHATVSKVTP
jgi:hypothetical protein